MAVDLGSSHVAVAVGRKNEAGELVVDSVVCRPIEGVNAGRIDNIELVSRAIAEAIAQIEQQLGIRITEVYAGISGEFVRCARHSDHVFTSDPQNGVNRNDVDALFDRMRNVQAPDDEQIMERIPLNYMVDDNQEVQNPVGSFGRRLCSTFNFLLCGKTPLQRLEMALKRVGIRTLGVFVNPQVAPQTVLSPDEREEGVALVDIGAGVTDVAVYYRNVLRYIAVIPMGASAINRDIRSQSIPEKHVERLKCQYGSAVADRASETKMVRVPGRTAREEKCVLLHNLATVIEARATDIAEFVLQELRDSGYAGRLAYGIVLTGGSSQLKDMDELMRRVTGMDVRLGAAEYNVAEESKQMLADPSLATVAGLLLKGAEQGSCVVGERPKTPIPQPVRPAAPVQNGRVEPAATAEPAARVRPASEPAADADQAGEQTEQPKSRDEEADEHYGQERSAGKRDFASILKNAINKINKSFNAAEDEEI